MNIEAGEGYRLLQIGETILEGDEFYSATSPTGWSRVVSNFGYVVQPFHMPVRRKLPAAAPTGWIKCSERLPDGKEPVWLFQPGDCILFSRSYILDDLIISGWTHWQPATMPTAPEPGPPSPGYGAAEMAAERYVESMALSPERSNARRDFMAGWEAGKP